MPQFLVAPDKSVTSLQILLSHFTTFVYIRFTPPARLKMQACLLQWEGQFPDWRARCRKPRPRAIFICEEKLMAERNSTGPKGKARDRPQTSFPLFDQTIA